MLVNYLDELNKEKINEIPETLLKTLSGKLPDGLKYANVQDGICCIVPEEKPLCIGGFKPIITEDIKDAIGDSADLFILQKYAYNAQKQIEFKPIVEGEMLINGNKVKIETFLIDPRHEKYFKDGYFVLIPEKMNESTIMTIGSKDNKRNMKFHRIPNNSHDVISFVSEGDDSLKCTINFNESTKKIKIHFSYDINNVRTIKDIVEVLDIFYAFKNNMGFINEYPVNISEFDDDYKFNEDALWFWRRVREVEKSIGASFDISKGNYSDYINKELVDDIELLFKSFVQKNPLRINSRIDKIEGDCQNDDEVICADSNTLMLLRFQLEYIFNLFGKEYRFPALIFVYNAKYMKKEIKDEKYKIFFEDKDENEKMYYSVMLFSNFEELFEFENKNDKIVELFKNAECRTLIKIVE